MSAHSETTVVPGDDDQPQTALDSNEEQTVTGRAEQSHDVTSMPQADAGRDAPKNGRARDRPKSLSLATSLGNRIARSRYGVPTVILLFVTALGGFTYFAWWYALPAVVEWSNVNGWRWVIGWMGVMFSAFAPVYFIMFVGPLVIATLLADDNRHEVQALDDLDHVEREIRGSDDPVDFARYSRKALKAYYHMGQSQVRISFYIGVFAMIFGFLFLLTGLLAQLLDLSQLRYIRKEPAVETVALGGGLIIEFIAATFLWIYRASIVQMNRYYRRQMLVHSALLSITLTGRMGDSKRGSAIASIVKTLIEPDVEVAFPRLPRPRKKRGVHSKNAQNGKIGAEA